MENDSSVMYLMPKESNVFYSLDINLPHLCPSMTNETARLVVWHGDTGELLSWDCAVGCAGLGGGGGPSERSHDGRSSPDTTNQCRSNNLTHKQCGQRCAASPGHRGR